MATITNYDSTMTAETDEMKIYYAAATTTGLDDVYHYIQMPRRFDGKRYRIQTLTVYQNSGAAKTIQVDIFGENLTGSITIYSASVGSATPTGATWSDKLIVPPLWYIRAYCNVNVAAKLFYIIVLLEVVD